MPFPRVLSRYLRRHVNKLAFGCVGHAAFADLEHIGRRSGAVHHTPLRAFRGHDRVLVGLNFGRESDWVKNIQAAGRCRMRLGNEQLELGTPRVVPVNQGIDGMPWLFGAALRYVVHTAECVELPVVSSTPAVKSASPPA